MCVEKEHLQVKLTMMVCPERAYEMFTSSQASVHSNSALRKLAGTTLISSCCPGPAHRIHLHQPSVLTSMVSINYYEDY